jgi:hypothetical protein
MQKNISVADQYLRLASGVVALASAAQCRRNSLAQALLTAYGAAKVAEGVTGWCPLMHALGIRTISEDKGHPATTRHHDTRIRKAAEGRSPEHEQGNFAGDHAQHHRHSQERELDVDPGAVGDAAISRETRQIGTAYQ